MAAIYGSLKALQEADNGTEGYLYENSWRTAQGDSLNG